jgi:CheY-specific phosphatase CheX
MSAQIDDDIIISVLDSVMAATTAHFQNSLNLTIISSQKSYGEIDAFSPADMTVVIGLSGPVNALVAYSFDNDLVNHLLEIETEGLEIPGDELDIYRHDVLAETVNIVLGHCTGDLARAGEPIGLTPPIVLEGKGSFRRPKGALFACVNLKTPYGILDIYTISALNSSDEYFSFGNKGER